MKADSLDKILITGKLSQHEAEINLIKADIAITESKLKIAYEYKDNLYDAMRQADDNIKAIQLDFFDKVNRIKEYQNKMLEELEIYVKTLY